MFPVSLGTPAAVSEKRQSVPSAYAAEHRLPPELLTELPTAGAGKRRSSRVGQLDVFESDEHVWIRYVASVPFEDGRGGRREASLKSPRFDRTADGTYCIEKASGRVQAFYPGDQHFDVVGDPENKGRRLISLLEDRARSEKSKAHWEQEQARLEQKRLGEESDVEALKGLVKQRQGLLARGWRAVFGDSAPATEHFLGTKQADLETTKASLAKSTELIERNRVALEALGLTLTQARPGEPQPELIRTLARRLPQFDHVKEKIVAAQAPKTAAWLKGRLERLDTSLETETKGDRNRTFPGLIHALQARLGEHLHTGIQQPLRELAEALRPEFRAKARTGIIIRQESRDETGYAQEHYVPGPHEERFWRAHNRITGALPMIPLTRAKWARAAYEKQRGLWKQFLTGDGPGAGCYTLPPVSIIMNAPASAISDTSLKRLFALYKGHLRTARGYMARGRHAVAQARPIETPKDKTTPGEPPRRLTYSDIRAREREAAAARRARASASTGSQPV